MKQKKHIFIPVLLSISIMPLEFIAELAFALVDLARMTIIVSIPAFLIVLLAQKLNQYIRAKSSLSWILAAFATTFLVLLPIVFVLYLVPFWAGYAASPLVSEQAPAAMQLTPIDYAMAVIATVFKNLLSALLFAVMLLPFIFFAAFAEEKVRERFKLPAFLNTFIATFLTTALAWIVILFVFPWVVPAIFWKLYWGPI